MIDDMPPVLLRKDKISYLSLVGTAYTRAEFEEDTAIPSRQRICKRIINTFSAVHTDEIKIIKTKCLLRQLWNFLLLYTTDTENEIIRKCEKSINISKIIDINEIDEGDDAVVNVTIGNMYVKPKADKKQ